jgi:hypothetical protein
MKKLLLLLTIIFITSINIFGQAIPKQIDYQGVLKTSAGSIVPDGNYQLTFKIYNDPTGGSALWTEVQTVAVANGIFSAHLGSVTPITTVPFNRIHFLGITIESDPELSPRTMLTPSPYSFMAMDITDNTVVKSLNSLKDDVNLVAGSNISITPSGNNLTISATGGGSGIGGSGTTNYIPVFTNSTSIGNSLISEISGKIGIDDNNPNYMLTINSGAAAGLGLKIHRTGGTNLLLKNDGSPTDEKGWAFNVYSTKLQIRTIADNDVTTLLNVATFQRNGNVGIGTESPAYPLHVQSSDADNVIYSEYTGTTAVDEIGVYGKSRPVAGYGIGGSFEGGWRGVVGMTDGTGYSSLTYGVYGVSSGGTTGTRIGVYGSATGGTNSYAGYFSGNAYVSGNLSKGGGSFKIDHPLDPANKYLYHSFVESPDMMNIYNGNIVTDGSGYSTVTLPEWFEALNKDFRYQLTVIGNFAQAIIYQKVQNNQFTIRTDKPNVEVSWQVTGIRKDAFAEKNRIPVEVLKKDDEVGKYIHPNAFGLPEAMGIDYEKNNSEREQTSK